jgi:magnesium transporter
MSENRFSHFSKQGKLYLLDNLQDTISAMENGGFVWLDYYNPQKEDLMALVDPLSIHPLSVEDCFDISHLPKIDFFPDHTFIIFNSFSYSEKILYIDEIALFLGKNFLVTVSGHNSDHRRPLNDLHTIIAKDPSGAKTGPAFLMHIVLDHVVDNKIYAFDPIEEELNFAEDQILSDPHVFDPSAIIHLRKDLMTLRKSLFHEREILTKISRMDSPFIPSKAIIHYRDIYDHLTKFFELGETYRDFLTSLLELYTSLLNNFMTRAANETNVAVRRLTLIATIFMPLTLVTGIFGMSEWTTMTGGPENYFTSYSLFFLGLIVTGVINYIVIRHIEKKTPFFRKRFKKYA